MGGSIGQIKRGSMASLCHPLPVAVPTFHGDRMDVSRRLRSRWLLCLAAWSGARSFCHATDCLAASSSDPVDSFAYLGAATKLSLLCGSFTPQFGIFILRIPIRSAQIQRNPASRSEEHSLNSSHM